jgi:hypothetical protein
MLLRFFYCLFVFSYASACINDMFLCRLMLGLPLFSLNDNILSALASCLFFPSAPGSLENLSSSSSASCRVSVLGEPRFLVKRLSVMSSWKLCFFLCPEPSEY